MDQMIQAEDDVENQKTQEWYNQLIGTGRKSIRSSNAASSIARSFSPGKRPINVSKKIDNEREMIKNKQGLSNTARDPSAYDIVNNRILSKSKKSDLSSERDDMRGIQKLQVPSISK